MKGDLSLKGGKFRGRAGSIMNTNNSISVSSSRAYSLHKGLRAQSNLSEFRRQSKMIDQEERKNSKQINMGTNGNQPTDNENSIKASKTMGLSTMHKKITLNSHGNNEYGHKLLLTNENGQSHQKTSETSNRVLTEN
jgi:hypothetical protein